MASLRDTTSRDCNLEPYQQDDTTKASRLVKDDGRYLEVEPKKQRGTY